MALTDLSGIGSKTAEKLRDKGISSEQELAEARRRGDARLREFGSRVNSAAIDAAVAAFGEYDDPILGVRVSEDNRSTIQTLSSRDTSDINEAGRVTRNNPKLQDASFLELGRRAVKGAQVMGDLGRTPTQQEISDTIVTPRPSGPNEVEDRSQIKERSARRNIAEMAFDAASNVADADRETIKEANELRERASGRGRKDPETEFTETYTYEIAGEEKESERNIRVSPREYAAAQRVHQARSPMAKRVDNRRRAETVTGDLDEWLENPGQVDYPGVDTPAKGNAAGKGFGYTPDETQIEARVGRKGGFNVKETSADGGGGFGRVEERGGEILSSSQETQRLVLGDLLPEAEEVEEMGLEPRGPDEELFFGDAEGDFI